MYVRWIAPLLFVATAGAAHAQSPNVLSGRPEADAAFARKLYDMGQTEMAESMCTLLEASGKLAGKAQTQVKSLHIDLRVDIARRTTDLAKKKDLLKVALQEKEDFVKQYQGTPEADTASLSLPDAYALLGDTIKQMVQKETEPTVVADYQAEGQRVYQEAEDRIKTRVDELSKEYKDRTDAGEDDANLQKLVEQLMTARYNLPRTLFGHAQLYAKDEFRRKSLLEEAITRLQEFGLDYSDVVYAYQASILEGQCQKELGNNDQALTIWTELANTLKGFYEPDKSGMITPDREGARLIARALLEKALLLSELNRQGEGVQEIKDFVTKTRGVYDLQEGLALLYQLGEMQLATGDTEGAGKSAEKLIEVDGNGPWGTNGLVLTNKILGKGGGENQSSEKLLALARTQVARRNDVRALELCRQAANNAKGDPDQAKTGLQAFLLMGDIFAKRGWDPEAALAYDAGAERYPNQDDAAEAVYRALQTYNELNSKEKNRPWFKRKVDEHMKLLTTRYPNHMRASFALLVEGQGYEGDDDFIKAAETYQKVQPNAKSYLIAQFQAGSAYFLHARKLAKDAAKKAEAKPFFDQSMSMLAKTIGDLDAAADKTYDLQEQQLYLGTAFKARMTLAQVQLDENVNKPGDALKTLEELDQNKKYNSNPENVAKVWQLRIKAYNSQGKLDEAAKLLDGLYAKTPDSAAIATAAFAVGREYDVRGRAAADKNDQKLSEEMWKRAARYYRISGQAQLRTGSGQVSDVTQVAERLYVLGLILNKVPGDSFLGWRGAKAANLDYWSLASELYESALRQQPSRKGTLYLARSEGFLGHWPEAAKAYADFFEGVNLVDRTTGKLNAQVLTEPESKELAVLLAYIEWGVSENRAGKANNESERFGRALGVFNTLDKNPAYVPADSREWWLYKVEKISALVNKSDFVNAGIELRTVKNTTNKVNEAVQEEFARLESEIAKNTFQKNGIQTPGASPLGNK